MRLKNLHNLLENYDHNHLSSIGSEMLAKKILTVIKKNK